MTKLDESSNARHALDLLVESKTPSFYNTSNGESVGFCGRDRFASGFLQESLKSQMHTPDFFTHRCEERKERTTFVWTDIAEGYLAGDVYLCIGAVWNNIAMGEQVREHYTFIQIARAGNNQSSVSMSDSEISHPSKATRSADGNQFHMLVDVRHTKESPKSLVPSVVRACPQNCFSQVTVEMSEIARQPTSALSRTLTTGDKAFPAIARREMDFFRASRASTQARKSDGSLVQGGSQLVDEFSSKHVKDFRGLRFKDDLRKFVSGLRICIENDPARVALKELPLGAFKLDQVVLRAL